MAPHLHTWAAKDIERLKLTADAKMRTTYRMFPAAVRQLHAWRLLTPAYKAFGALGVQVSKCMQGHDAGSILAALATHIYCCVVAAAYFMVLLRNSHCNYLCTTHPELIRPRWRGLSRRKAFQSNTF
jgi:hypothetical protein